MFPAWDFTNNGDNQPQQLRLVGFHGEPGNVSNVYCSE